MARNNGVPVRATPTEVSAGETERAQCPTEYWIGKCGDYNDNINRNRGAKAEL